MYSILDTLYDTPNYRAKDKQKAVIYHTVSTHPGLTRKKLAEQLALRGSTVSNLVQQLLDAGLLREGELRTNGRQGRPQIALHPNFNRFVSIALYFVSMELKGALLNAGHEVIAEYSVTLSKRTDHAQLTQRILEVMNYLYDQAPAAAEVLGCGITFPGYVDTHQQRWLFAARWPNLRNFSVRNLEHHTSLPLICRRSLDAELEFLLSAHPEYRDGATLLVHWGYGIGSSFAYQGDVIQPSAGGFGEIGHVDLCHSPDNLECICGRRGCVETEAALWAILPKLKETLDELPEAEDAFAQAFASHNLTDHPVVTHAVTAFTRAMTTLYTLLAPDRMILYGPFLNSDTLFERVRDGIFSELPSMFSNLFTVERIETGFTGDLYGATVEFFRDAYRKHLVAD